MAAAIEGELNAVAFVDCFLPRFGARFRPFCGGSSVDCEEVRSLGVLGKTVRYFEVVSSSTVDACSPVFELDSLVGSTTTMHRRCCC